MSLRKEVFQAKVLQRLYPGAPKTENVRDATPPSPKPAPPPGGVRPNPPKTAGVCGECRVVNRKVYTVLPPPDDYRPSIRDGSASPPPTGITSVAHEPAADLSGSSDHDGTDEDLTRRRRRRRRRKRKADVVPESSESGGGTSTLPQGAAAARRTQAAEEESVLETQGPEAAERLNRNQKRKMKKKRRKEKLLSLGVMPRTRALEFTYTQGGDQDQDLGDEAAKLQEVLDFLRSMWNLHLSDRSRDAGQPFPAVAVAESLFARVSDGPSPPTGLTCLCRLWALLRQQDVGRLSSALQEFSSTSTLPADETAVVLTLFQYWITEVLPVLKERDT